MNNNRSDSKIIPGGLYIPCLKEGESTYNLTPEVLSALMRKAYHDGYQFAKSIYNISSSANSWDVVKETNHGTH
jgi:hypothetical protein